MQSVRWPPVTAVTAALAIILTVGAVALPAGAVASQQCDPGHTCMNFWGGGFAVRTYHGETENNHMWIHWLGNGTFELRDAIHSGTCVGDLDGANGNPAMGGGNNCPSAGNGDWGTVFSLVADAICPNGYVKFWSRHWLAYVGWVSGNNHVVSESTQGSCILPET